MAKKTSKGIGKKSGEIKIDTLPAPAGKLAKHQMKNIKGGAESAYKDKKAFEIKDFSFGVENPS